MSASELQELSRSKVNMETARIQWRELQRFFASGAAIFVDCELDLVEVAFQFSEDNKQLVENWMQVEKVALVTDAQAKVWHIEDTIVWAVVVSPWVLVQPVQLVE